MAINRSISYGGFFHFPTKRHYAISVKIGRTDSPQVADVRFESSSGFRDAFGKLFGTAPSKSSGVHCLLSKWIDSPLGAILALADDDGLYVFDWVDRRGLEREIVRLRAKTKFAIVPGSHPVFDQATHEIDEYFAGKRKIFTLPFAHRGTDFQRQV